MLPVVAGRRTTRRQVFIYSLPMAASAVAPWLLGLTGPVYGATAVALTGAFLLLAARVAMSRETEPAKMAAERQMFAFSVLYLFILFGEIGRASCWERVCHYVLISVVAVSLKKIKLFSH